MNSYFEYNIMEEVVKVKVLVGNISISNINQIKDFLYRILPKFCFYDLEIDCTELEVIDSTSVRIMWRLFEYNVQQKKYIHIINLNDTLIDLLNHLKVCDTEYVLIEDM